MNRLWLVAPAVLALVGCPKDEKVGGDVPPPVPTSAPPTAAGGGACANPGEVKDPLTAEIFPRSPAGYCVDPKGETKVYGEKAKLSMDEVCTTAFDGECEVYKSYGLKRLVRFMYVDGSGGPGVVEVTLCEFDDMPGAYGMFTKRVVAQDPLDKTAPRVLLAQSQGAMGTGRAYVWRGNYMLELQYNNDKETPEALAKSSNRILGEVGKAIGEKLPGALNRPRAAEALPTDFVVPNGIEYVKEPFGIACGHGAVGYYKQTDRRHREIALAGEGSPSSVEDCMKAIAKRPGALPVKELKDNEGTAVVLQSSPDAPKLEFVFARKGNVIYGVGDEEYALTGKTGEELKKARYGKDASIARMKDVLTKSEGKGGDAGAPASNGDAGVRAAKGDAGASGTAVPAPKH